MTVNVWTQLNPADIARMDGTIEWKLSPDGTVNFRGVVTLNTPGLSGQILAMPAEIHSVNDPIYFDWTGLLTDKNCLYSGGALVVGNFNSVGFSVDMAQISWIAAIPVIPPVAHSLENVLQGLREALQAIPKLRVYDFPSNKVEPPAAVLSLPETPYDVTLGGRSDEWTFPLWILVSKADDRSAYKEMVPYLDSEGERSIRAMIEVDRTLGGACDTCAVVRARPQFASVGGVEFLAIEFTLEVFT